MTKIYIYKLTVDDGGAPCIRDGLLSLAICKPAIRSTAEANNVILGFAGNNLYKDNCLIYAATVSRKLPGKGYFGDGSYANRPDCIYTWNGQDFERRVDSKFHASAADLIHDLGEPPAYKRANVLLSDDSQQYPFRYFRDKISVPYKQHYPRLKALIERLGQGHRVNFGEELHEELRHFLKRVWATASAYGETILGDVPCRDKCSSDDEDYACGEY